MTHNQRFSQGLETYTKALNHFSHLTHEEVTRRFTGLQMPTSQHKNFSHPLLKPIFSEKANVNGVPTSIDWRQVKGVVQPVKNQAQCGYIYIPCVIYFQAIP